MRTGLVTMGSRGLRRRAGDEPAERAESARRASPLLRHASPLPGDGPRCGAGGAGGVGSSRKPAPETRVAARWRRPVIGARGCGEIRQALGVYLLGAIGPADRSAVSSHLAGCADCREVLARLAGLPGLLGNVPTADAIRLATEEADRAGGDEVPPGVTLPSLLVQVARLRRHRLWRRLALTAAAVVIAAGGAVAGSRVLYPPAERPAAA